MKNRATPSSEANHDILDTHRGLAWVLLSLLLFGLVFLPMVFA